MCDALKPLLALTTRASKIRPALLPPKTLPSAAVQRPVSKPLQGMRAKDVLHSTRVLIESSLFERNKQDVNSHDVSAERVPEKRREAFQ